MHAVDAVKSTEFSPARKVNPGGDSVLRYRLGVYNKHFWDAARGASLVGSHYAMGTARVLGILCNKRPSDILDR